MSYAISALLRRRNLGIGQVRKSVLFLMADRVDDDGYSYYESKSRLAAQMEAGPRTIQRAIDALVADGFLACIGRRKNRNGFTFEYRVVPAAIEGCEQIDPYKFGEVESLSRSDRVIPPVTVTPPSQRSPTPVSAAPHTLSQRHPNQSGTTLKHGGVTRAHACDHHEANAQAEAPLSIPVAQPPASNLEHATEREQLLVAMRHDPGAITAAGRMLGTHSDLAEARRWATDLGLSIDEQIAVIETTMRTKPNGLPPNSFRYFTKAMQRAAADKRQPLLKPLTAIGGTNSNERLHRYERLRRTIQAAAAGTSSTDWG